MHLRVDERRQPKAADQPAARTREFEDVGDVDASRGEACCQRRLKCGEDESWQYARAGPLIVECGKELRADNE